MKGSKNYDTSPYNIAQNASRGAGSSNKAFVVAYALGHGWKSDTKLTVPQRIVVPGRNGGKAYVIDSGQGCDRLGRPLPCTMTLEEGLAVSSNTVAGLIVKRFGIEPIVKEMNAFGVTVNEPYGPAVVLGAGGYSTRQEAEGFNNLILNRGAAVGSYIIDKITKGGATVYEHKPSTPKRVVDERVAIDTIKALNKVTTIGTARGAVHSPSGRSSVAGKTGTTNDSYDLWWTGSVCSPDPLKAQTVSIWAGNPKAEKYIGTHAIGSHTMAALFSTYLNTLPRTAGRCTIWR